MPVSKQSKFGGIPVEDDVPQRSKFGGIPVEETPRRSKFGGIPVEDTPLKLPPGATLVQDSSPSIKLPPGATLVSSGNEPAPPDAGERMRSSALMRIGATMPQAPAFQPPSMLQRIGQGVSDVAAGFGDEAASRIHQGGRFLRENVPGLKRLDDAYWRVLGHSGPTEEQWRDTLAPTNTLQRLGGGLEQAAEFLVPGATEEKAAQLATRAIPSASRLIPLTARVGASALGSGLVNASQGGDFGTGAVVGGVGGAIGEGMKAVAPAFAESALGIRKAVRFYGKSPGRAVLEETTGHRPAKDMESARDKVRSLTGQVETMAAQSPRLTTLTPARTVVNDATQTAQSENNPKALAQLQPLIHQLSTNVTNGLPLSSTQSAKGLLNLKRGFGDAVAWSPEMTKSVNAVGKRAYHALDQEFDKAVPGAADMNQRVSSLIPVIKRAESAEHGAPVAQRIVHRLAAHTGAATLAGLGGVQGYREGGVPGAVTGAIGGLVIPELIATPTGQMAVARSLASPKTHRVLLPLVRGTGLQADR